ncbi:MAG TPA: STAS domain-containing protein [bacterium]|nr:STAS domain-containing protein [bacterium]
MRVEFVDQVAVVRPMGPMVSEVVEDLHAALAGLMRQEIRQIVVDLSEVDLITSAGLGLLYAALQEVMRYKGALVLASPCPAVIHVIRDWGLERILPIYPTAGEACAVLQAAQDIAPPV